MCAYISHIYAYTQYKEREQRILGLTQATCITRQAEREEEWSSAQSQLEKVWNLASRTSSPKSHLIRMVLYFLQKKMTKCNPYLYKQEKKKEVGMALTSNLSRWGPSLCLATPVRELVHIALLLGQSVIKSPLCSFLDFWISSLAPAIPGT